jgi:radical SAM superfamily enzyme YgiQ (UPF0313 family)
MMTITDTRVSHEPGRYDALFVVPPLKYQKMGSAASISPHLGITSVAGFLEKNGFKVGILDTLALQLSWEKIREQIEGISTPVVGVTAMTPEFPAARAIATLVKDIHPDTITIMGGHHVTIMPESAYCDEIDYIVIGEGELTALELMTFLHDGVGKREEIRGIGYKRNGAMYLTDPRPLIRNIDELPLFAYHLLPMDKYRNYAYYDDGRRYASLVTSRGCPFPCTFCSCSAVFGRKWRSMSPEKVLQEITALYKEFDIRYIFFQDDEFTLDHNRTLRICDLLIEGGFDLRWGCMARVDHLDEKLLSNMSKAGCTGILLGAECGYQEGLERIKKRITLDQIHRAVELTREHKIFSVVSFMMGFPWEGEDEIKATIKFAKTLDADMFLFLILTPYPGTELYKQIKDEGLLVSGDWSQYTPHAVIGNLPVIRTRFLSSEDHK